MIQPCRIYQDDSDRQDFLSRLGHILGETRTSCYAWALMPNHFHLLLRTGDAPISIVMKRILTGYAVRFNRRHRRSGHLFQNRYKSILCQEDAICRVGGARRNYRDYVEQGIGQGRLTDLIGGPFPRVPRCWTEDCAHGGELPRSRTKSPAGRLHRHRHFRRHTCSSGLRQARIDSRRCEQRPSHHEGEATQP